LQTSGGGTVARSVLEENSSEKRCVSSGQFGMQRSPAGLDEMYRRKIKYTKKQTQAVSGEDIKVEVD
jgi:hypothetical protein